MEIHTTPTLSPDISRFVKFFLIKSCEIIISSRTNNGKKVKSECKLPNNQLQGSQADWFNLHIPPTPTTPTILSRLHPHLLQNNATTPTYSITIETHLATDDVVLPLERWRFLVDQRGVQTPRDVYNVYNRLGLMVKSVICVSRATPGFKIAKKSSPDVTIGYEIKSDLIDEDFEEDKMGALLGEGFKVVSLGKVPLTTTPTPDIPDPTPSSPTTPSFISTTLYYRTRMELTLSRKELLIKSDHYSDKDVSTVIPAFGGVPITFQEENEEEEGFFKIKSKTVKSVVVPPEPHPLIPTPPDHTPEKDPSLNLPFVTMTTTGSQVKDSSNSSNSESELLNLFEEFRVAPVTLESFDKNLKGEESVGGGVDFRVWEEEGVVWDEFCKGLSD